MMTFADSPCSANDFPVPVAREIEDLIVYLRGAVFTSDLAIDAALTSIDELEEHGLASDLGDHADPFARVIIKTRIALLTSDIPRARNLLRIFQEGVERR